MYSPYSPNPLNSTSVKMFGNGDFGLTHRQMKYAISKTFQNASDYKNPLAFPLLDKNLSGLPTVYIATRALDPLKDDKPKSGLSLQISNRSDCCCTVVSKVTFFFRSLKVNYYTMIRVKIRDLAFT